MKLTRMKLTTDMARAEAAAASAEPESSERRECLRRMGQSAGAALVSAMLPGAVGSAFAATRGADIVGLDAIELSRRIKARDLSCVEVMDAFLAQIRRFNPNVNAIVALQDEALLRQSATERDRQLARGEYMGWMHGLPHAVKDLALTAGIRTTSGSSILKDYVPTADAVMVERIKRAGAIIIGKTNTPEFGLGSQTYNPVYGTTLNAYDQTKCAGGSSGGAAVALALNMLPVADGSDMGGSLRNPAAYNNVYGFRPTAGRIPFAPTGESFVQQLGYEGPMARTVKDLAMLLSVQAGYDARAPLSIAQDPAMFTGSLERDWKGTRVAWLGDWNGHLPMEPGVLELCQSGLKTFQDIGCVVEAAVPAYDPAKLWEMWLTHRHWLVGNGLRPFYDDPTKRALMKPEAVFEVEGSLRQTAAEVYVSSVARSAWVASLNKFFEKYDFLIIPTAQVFPFDAKTPWPKEVGGKVMRTYHQWMEVVLPWTLSGCPVISVPVGFNATGLPMGVQVIGKRQADLAVLQLAFAHERATGWVKKRPPSLLRA